MSKLTERINASKQQSAIEAKIAEKLATGKFKNTGAVYTPDQAMADHNNPALRLTASIDNNNNLNWK